MKKLLGIILAITIVLSSMSMIFVSADPIAPTLPDNVIAVLDANGISNTLGSNGEWRANWFEGRFAKTVDAVDISKAEYIEFDIKYSNYDAFKAYIDNNGYNLTFSVTSSGNVWDYRSAAYNILNYGKAIGNGWYHYALPISAFVPKSHSGVALNAVNNWMIFGENADVAFGELHSETLTIINICATALPEPAMPENCIVIDEAGFSNFVGAEYIYAFDNLHKPVNTVDLSAASFIEFDMKCSNYEALKDSVNHGVLPEFYIMSNGHWGEQSFTQSLIFDNETGEYNGWRHYKFPKALFTAGVDWSRVNHIMFGFFASAHGASSGALGSATISIKNVCGTFAPTTVPAAPANTTVLDAPFARNLGTDINSQLYGGYGWMANTVATPVDYSTTNYIELDIWFSNYAEFERHMVANGLAYELNLTSNGIWWERSAVNIMRYGKDVGNGWRHYTIPRYLFGARDDVGQGVDWTRVNTWFLMANAPVAEGWMWADSIIVANICGTTFAPEAPADSVMLDSDGGVGVFGGGNFIDFYAYMYKFNCGPVDLSAVSAIEFDLKFTNYDDFIKALELYPQMSLDFRITSANQHWDSVLVSRNILPYMTKIDDGVFHVALPKSTFGAAGTPGVLDWTNVNGWYMIVEGGQVSTTVNGINMSLDGIQIKNICGTNKQVEVVAPQAYVPAIPLTSVVTADKDGFANTIGDEYNWLWDRLFKQINPVDFSDADYIEFDIKTSNYEALKSASTEYTLAVTFNTGFAATGNKWIQRHYVFDVFSYEVSADGDWHHIRIPKANFAGEEGANWASKDFWMFGFWGGHSVATGDLAAASIDVKNICGTTYSLKSDAYAMIDNYALIAEGKAVADVASATNKIYTANGVAVSNGNVVTGMTVQFEFDGWVYDKATVVVENDIDADGAVTAADLTLAKKFYFDAATATEIQNVALTGSRTAAASILDYIQLKNALLG